MKRTPKSGGNDPAEKTLAILQAVRTVLAREGYAGTTIAKVAAEAGVSRGLLHYHFKNKEEMIANVLRANMEGSADLVFALSEQSESAEAFADAVVQALRSRLRDDPDYFNLFIEGLAAAPGNPVISGEMDELYHEFRNALIRGLEVMAERGAITPAMSIQGLATLIMAILDGLSIQLLTVLGMRADEDVWNALRTGLILLLKGAPETPGE